MMQVEHTYTDEDFQVLARYALRWWHLLAIPLGCLLAALPGAVVSACLRHEQLALGVLGLVLLASLHWSFQLMRKGAVDKSIQKPQTVTLTPEFLVTKSCRGEGRWRWRCIEEVVEFRERLLMPMGAVCWILPVSAFPSRTEFDAFQQAVRKYVEDAARTPFDPDSPPPPGPFPAEDVQFEACFRNAPGDDRALRRAAVPNTNSLQALQGMLAYFGIGVFLQFSSLAFPLDLGVVVLPPWLFILVGQVLTTLFCLTPAMLLAVRMTAWLERRDRLATLPRRLQVSRERLALSTRYYEQVTSWQDLEAIVHDSRYVYLFRRRSPADGLAVPKEAFADAGEVERFCQLAVANHAAALARNNTSLPPRVIPPRVAVESGNPYQPPGTGEMGP